MSTIKGTRLALTPWPLQFSFQNPVTLSSLSTKALLWGWPREVRTLKGLSKGFVCIVITTPPRSVTNSSSYNCQHRPQLQLHHFYSLCQTLQTPFELKKTAKLEWLINLRYFDDHQIVDQNSPTFRYFLPRQIQFIDANEKEEEYLLQLQEPYQQIIIFQTLPLLYCVPPSR